MNPHLFLFTPANWVGTGEIKVALTKDRLPFTVHWQVDEACQGVIEMVQLIKIEGVAEMRQNRFRVSHLSEASFAIELDAPLVGQVKGTGTYDPHVICWEFQEGLLGKERYVLEQSGAYQFEAAYASGEGLSNEIRGKMSPLV